MINKKAIVTGGSQGIGKGIVIKLASEGYDIVFSYNSKKDEAENLVNELSKKYHYNNFYCLQASFNEKGSSEKFFNDAIELLNGTLDVLVNNAGVTIFESAQELKEKTLDFLLNLNFKNYIMLMSLAIKHMMKTNTKGSIVNITSSRGERAYPGDGVYGGIKAGLNRLIQSFALDAASYGIRVNNVAPGCIKIRTDVEKASKEMGIPKTFWSDLGKRVPLRRIGQPEDIANAVSFLISDNASYITGITIRVDGGLILPGMPEIE